MVQNTLRPKSLMLLASNKNPSMAARWATRVTLAVAIWTAIGLVFALPSLAAGGHWRPQLLASLAQWWSWGLLAPAIVAVDQWLPFSSKQPVWRVVAHLFLSLAFTAVYVYLFAMVIAMMGLGPWSRLFGLQLLIGAVRGMFLWSVLVYCLIVGVWQAYLYHQRYLSGELRMERLERSFSEARLNALRMQLDPHFLFNALNTISAQVEREPRLARQMIEHLGDLLRLSLENKDRQEVPLLEEMAFLEHYLAIQRIRFGDRLRFDTNIAQEVKYSLVPCLIVQPLVENAIRHGISSRATGGRVSVMAQRIEEQIEIRVTDDGVGLPPGWTLETSAGLGLSVTRERIRGLHPDGRFVVRRLRSGGTEALIQLPLRFSPETDAAREAGHDSAAD
ncbi:sensor histidine kinase [Acidicapsa acidisoli]|uniref:sensor histidine kinase n=1 Tax=Acidicapsa acidisoli TaxID=1615681 RepID=UPI0021E057B7|nr:histidine kinase [Acidicapsa acidisoli]